MWVESSVGSEILLGELDGFGDGGGVCGREGGADEFDELEAEEGEVETVVAVEELGCKRMLAVSLRRMAEASMVWHIFPIILRTEGVLFLIVVPENYEWCMKTSLIIGTTATV